MSLLQWLFGKKKTLPEWVKDSESYERWKSGLITHGREQPKKEVHDDIIEKERQAMFSFEYPRLQQIINESLEIINKTKNIDTGISRFDLIKENIKRLLEIAPKSANLSIQIQGNSIRTTDDIVCIDKAKTAWIHSFQENISIAPSNSGFDNPNTGAVIPSNDGGYILNPQSTFPLTIYGIDQHIAKEFKQILDSGYCEGSYKTVQNVMPIVARYNVRCKEVDDYKKTFKPLYLQSIEKQKESSSEWTTASDLDKEDLLAEFKDVAIASLDIQPDCDLGILFEADYIDMTVDDVLIDKYGYDTIRFYLSRKIRVHIITADHDDRKKFERLVEVGLAIRGENIHVESVLGSLTLKEMSTLVSDLSPPKFSRKAKAIEYLSKLPDLKERLHKTISFRSLFCLQSLSEEFSKIDLEKVSLSWQYAQELANLIIGTYYHAGYSTRDYNGRKEIGDSFITGWEISVVNDDRCCPYCKKASSKKYPKNQHPKVPLHIGCRCHVSPIFKND